MLRKISFLPTSSLQTQIDNTKSLIDLIKKYQESVGSSPVRPINQIPNLQSTLYKKEYSIYKSNLRNWVENTSKQHKLGPSNVFWFHKFYIFLVSYSRWNSCKIIVMRSIYKTTFSCFIRNRDDCFRLA